MKPFSNLIDGQWTAGAKVTTNINPSDTNDVIGHYASASASQVDDAVRAARAAFPKWSRTTPQLRHDILARAAQEVLSRREELGKLVAREEGKTLAEAIGEATRAGQALSYMAGQALRLPGESVPSLVEGGVAEVTREPLGVIGVISPWNFPIAIPACKIAPALAYGNCVVFKPAGLTPAAAWSLVDILHRAGVPPGVLNLVMGSGMEVGEALTTHDEIDAIAFTGSVPTGRGIAKASVAGPNLKRIQMEMGGKNPLVVLDDADLKVAVECAVNGAFFSTGQRCTASSRFIVSDGVHDRFVDAVVQRIKTLTVGHALEPSTHIGPVVDERQLETDLSYLKIGQDEGATLKHGGSLLSRPTPGFYFEPALLTNAANSMRVSREEIFGPVAVTIRVKDYEEALAVANDTEFGLTAGICTSSLKYATHFKRNAEAGVVKVNQPTCGFDYNLPFGGRKASSFGPREMGRDTADFFTIVKTAYVFSG